MENFPLWYLPIGVHYVFLFSKKIGLKYSACKTRARGVEQDFHFWRFHFFIYSRLKFDFLHTTLFSTEIWLSEYLQYRCIQPEHPTWLRVKSWYSHNGRLEQPPPQSWKRGIFLITSPYRNNSYKIVPPNPYFLSLFQFQPQKRAYLVPWSRKRFSHTICGWNSNFSWGVWGDEIEKKGIGEG